MCIVKEMENQGLEFGFVPTQVVKDLQDIGNWKSRATAIDALQKALRDSRDRQQLTSQLPKLVQFLMTLVADPNFKISISSMQIVGDVVSKIGREIEPHLRNIVPILVEKFTDSKILVRSANMKVLKRLMGVVSPNSVLELLRSSMKHSSWRVREEILNTHILAMLTFDKEQLDYMRVTKAMSGALRDSKDRVRSVALEGLAVVHTKVGNMEFQSFLNTLGLQDNNTKVLVQKRVANPVVPTINAEGMVEHTNITAVPLVPEGSDGSLVVEDVGRTSPGAGFVDKLSWEYNSQRPRNRVAHAPALFAESPRGALEPSPLNKGIAELALDGPLANVRHMRGEAPNHNVARGLPSEVLPSWPSYPAGNKKLHDVAERHESTSPVPPVRQPLVDSILSDNRIGSKVRRSGEQMELTPSPLGPAMARLQQKKSSSGDQRQASKPAASGPIPSPAPGPTRRGEAAIGVVPQPGSGPNKEFSTREARSLHPVAPEPPLPRRGHGQQYDDWVVEDFPSTPAVPNVPQHHHSSWPQTDGRDETYSPSRGERLAKLKLRQIEKRANSAQVGVKPIETASSGSSNGYISSPTSLLADFHREHSHELHGSPSYQSSAESSNRAQRRPLLNTFDPPQHGILDNNRNSKLAMLTRNNSWENISRHSPEPSSGGGVSSGGGGKPALSKLSRDSSSPVPGRRDLNRKIQPSPGPIPNGGLSSLPAYLDVSENGRRHIGNEANKSVGNRSVRSKSADTGAKLASSYGPASFLPLSNGPVRGGTVIDRGAKPPGLAEFAYEDLLPVGDSPEKVFRQVIIKLQESNAANHKELDWLGQYEAINDGRRLVKYNPETVKAQLHDFVKQAKPAIDALRSYTSKNVLLLFSEMFQTYGRGMDKELDDVVPLLLKKAGDLSTAGRENFLATEADRVLSEMCRLVTDTKAITVLCASAGHKANFVRQKVAFHLDEILEVQAGNPRNSLTSNSSCLERLFRTAAGFLEEGALETRTYGKRIIWGIKQCVGNRDDFDRLVGLLKQELQKKVTDVVEGSNGPPPPPSKGGGARNRVGSSPAQLRVEAAQQQRTMSPGMMEGPGELRSKSISAPSGMHLPNFAGAPDKGQAAQLCNAEGGSARNASVNKRRSGNKNDNNPTGAMSPASQELLDKAVSKLSAKDFRDRMDALQMLGDVIADVPLATDTVVISMLDGLIARLSDGNSKVNTQALELMVKLFPHLRERIALSINTLVPALAANLGASNEKIKTVANRATEQLIHSVDPALLIQNFSHCVANGNMRGKPVLVEKLQAIIKSLYPTRPQLIIKYAVPAACSLLNDARGDTKLASSELLGTLSSLMGNALIDHAASLGPAIQQKVIDYMTAGRV